MWLEKHVRISKPNRKDQNEVKKIFGVKELNYRPAKFSEGTKLHLNKSQFILLTYLLFLTIFVVFILGWQLHCKRIPKFSNNSIETSAVLRIKTTNFPVAFYDYRCDNVLVFIYSKRPHGAGQRYCHCLDSNLKQISVPDLCRIRDTFMLHCHCATKAGNCSHIGLTTNGDFNEVTRPIQVRKIPQKLSPKFNNSLAVCLAPIFGTYQNWFLLLQFVEWYRILKVTKIFAYVHISSDFATKTVLKHYVYALENFLEWMQLSTDGDCASQHSCRHDYQLNDCIYRTMNRYRFVALLDIDELLVPLQHKTLFSLIESLDAPFYGSFSFRCRWVPRYHPDPAGTHLLTHNWSDLTSLIDTQLPLVRYLWTTHPAPIGHTPKPIVKPETVGKMGVHHVHRWFFNETVHREFVISTDMAYVRHFRYRESWLEKFYRDSLSFGTYETTEVPKMLKLQLLKAVKCRVKAVRKEYYGNDTDNLICFGGVLFSIMNRLLVTLVFGVFLLSVTRGWSVRWSAGPWASGSVSGLGRGYGRYGPIGWNGLDTPYSGLDLGGGYGMEPAYSHDPSYYGGAYGGPGGYPLDAGFRGYSRFGGYGAYPDLGYGMGPRYGRFYGRRPLLRRRLFGRPFGGVRVPVSVNVGI